MRISDWSSDVCSSDLRVASLLRAKGSTDRDGVRGSVRRSLGWSAQALSLTESANAPWDRSILREPIRRRPVARQQYCPIRVGSCRNGTYREHEGKRDCDGPCRCPLIVRLLMARAASGGSKGPRRCIAERAQSRP